MRASRLRAITAKAEKAGVIIDIKIVRNLDPALAWRGRSQSGGAHAKKSLKYCVCWLPFRAAHARLAQLAEHQYHTLGVAGSSPASRTISPGADNPCVSDIAIITWDRHPSYPHIMAASGYTEQSVAR